MQAIRKHTEREYNRFPQLKSSKSQIPIEKYERIVKNLVVQ